MHAIVVSSYYNNWTNIVKCDSNLATNFIDDWWTSLTRLNKLRAYRNIFLTHFAYVHCKIGCNYLECQFNDVTFHVTYSYNTDKVQKVIHSTLPNKVRMQIGTK
jgi:hypothetical protein